MAAGVGCATCLGELAMMLPFCFNPTVAGQETFGTAQVEEIQEL
jgi:hypothetical protein